MKKFPQLPQSQAKNPKLGVNPPLAKEQKSANKLIKQLHAAKAAPISNFNFQPSLPAITILICMVCLLSPSFLMIKHHRSTSSRPF